MKQQEITERGFSVDKHGKVLDDAGNEYRNEEGFFEFLIVEESCQNVH